MEKELNRKDGRLSQQLRPIEMEQGFLQRADGSARFSQGASSVIVAVYGPLEVPSHKELMDRSLIQIIYKSTVMERDKEYFIRNTIENIIISTLYPRTMIEIVIQVLNEDGSILSTALNGVCLALLDAGISLRSLIISTTISFNNQKKILLDPTLQEEKDALSTFIFGMDPHHLDELLSCKCIGLFEEEDFFSCFQIAKQSCQHIFSFFRLSETKRFLNI